VNSNGLDNHWLISLDFEENSDGKYLPPEWLATLLEEVVGHFIEFKVLEAVIAKLFIYLGKGETVF